jgi:hypothetical protein
VRRALLICVLWMGCTIDEKVGQNARIACNSEAECPAGMVCREVIGLCVRPSGSDEAPSIVGTPVITPLVARAGTKVTVSFDVSAPLFVPPSVRAELGGAVLPLTRDDAASSAQHQVFSFTPDGSETEGTARLYTDLVSEGGIAAPGLALGSVVLDFTAPNLIAFSVAYVPGPDNPLAQVQKATAGTTLVVTVAADEAIATAPSPALTAVNGADTLTFTITNRTAFGVTFAALVPAGIADGVYQPRVAWADLAGNATAAAVLPTPRDDLEVLTARPVLSIAQGQVRYSRSPWGNRNPEVLDGGFVVPPGAYFSLAPFEPLSGASELPRSTFQFPGGGASMIRARVWSGADDGLLLGTMEPIPDGGWPRLELLGVDVPSAWVSGIDEAGNESARQKVDNAEWVATASLPYASATNPHRLFGTRFVQPTIDQADPLGTGTAGDARDAGFFTVSSERSWRQVEVQAAAITQRYALGMAYDTARGRMVLYGGYDPVVLGDTWERVDATWVNRQPAAPRPGLRTDHSMVYDSARGKVMLFGGWDGVKETGELWEWDGSTWAQLQFTGAAPPARWDQGMVYDSARGRLVMFGGWDGTQVRGDIWEWDGTRWSDRTPVGTRPSAREYPAMAYDVVRRRTVMVGTNASNQLDTWEWDGTNWVDKTPAGTKPTPRGGTALVYDPVRQRVVLFGGGASLNDLWEWDGANWVDKTPAGLKPPGRRYHAMAWDPVRQRVVVFGGRSSVGLSDTWEWDGASWTNATSTPAVPTVRDGHSMVWDTTRGRAVLFGGSQNFVYQQDLWEWDGVAWVDKTPTGTRPPPRDSAAAVYDSTRARMVLFGGRGSSTWADTWEWVDGGTWVDVTPADGGGPTYRQRHAMAFDSARGKTVLFGGQTSSTIRTDTWEWDGANWVEKALDGGATPVGRYSHAMEFDSVRQRVVVFGGVGVDGGRLNDLWEWDGAAWVDKTPTGTKPPARDGAALAFDKVRGQLVLVGGGPNALGTQDLWEWDGAAWADKTPLGQRPSPRRGHAMVFDERRGKFVLFGGYSLPAWINDTWELDAAASRQPAISFQAKNFGLPAANISGIRVRADCGGRHFTGAGGGGATLYGWASGLNSSGVQGWISLASNQAQSPTTALVDWVAGSSTEAEPFFFEPGLTFQCRSSGGAGTGSGEAQVSFDFFEVRVRYDAP